MKCEWSITNIKKGWELFSYTNHWRIRFSQKELIMKVDSILIQPPSLALRLEGKSNSALNAHVEENIQVKKVQEQDESEKNPFNLLDILA